MASGGKRRGGGERILEGRHVVGLFFLMLLFSGLFFTLGYVMGRDQYSGQVRAESNPHLPSDPVVPWKPNSQKRVPDAKPAEKAPVTTTPDTTADSKSDWDFYHAGEPKKTEDHLTPAPPTAKSVAPVAKNAAPAEKTSAASSKSSANSLQIPPGAYALQVAALSKEADAFDLANRLQKKKFPAFVISPQKDKFYHVQVGPYADQKSAEAARKGLEAAGFKAIVKHG